MKFPTCWEFDLCQFRDFLKTTEHAPDCPQNAFPACLVRRRRRIVSAHARTIKRGL